MQIRCFFLLIFFSVSFAQNEYKPSFLPAYNPNINVVQKEIEDWIAREKANASKKDTFVVLKTDVLGRHLSSGSVEMLKKSRKISKTEQKRLVVIHDMQLSDELIDEVFGRYEYNATTKTKKYYLDGQEFSEKDYFNRIEKIWEKHRKVKRGERNLHVPGKIRSGYKRWIARMTAKEISEFLDENKEFAISDYIEPQDNATRDQVLNLTQLSSHAFSNGYTGNGVGIYFVETGCPNLVGAGIYTYNYVQINYCSNGVRSHPTGVTRVLQMAGPSAKIYGSDQGEHPTNPFSYSTPIEIGTHSWSVGGAQYYGSTDAYMDNYVYEDKVIEFVAAGNDVSGNDYLVPTPGKAVNAITVGAVNPDNGYYASYSRWKNSEIGNEKPEVATYTDINFSDNSVMLSYFGNGIFNGTSAAAPLLAGFTATLLEMHPFFKRHPALVKALYIAGSTKPINGNHDQDNSKSAKALVLFSSVAWNTRSIFWEGSNSSHFNSNNEIILTENVQANKRYRIAIAWLSAGNYVLQHSALSQDIDLHVYQNGNLIASSTSRYNPFEVVDFTTSSNAPLAIRVHRYRNSGGNVLMGYNLWENN